MFTNGFNPNTGTPWVESITDDRTKPAGNGVAFTAPVTRDGGTVLPNGSARLAELPASPCRLGAALHRRRRRHVGVLRRPADPADLLPAQGRQGVDGLRQAEHGGRARCLRIPARPAATRVLSTIGSWTLHAAVSLGA